MGTGQYGPVVKCLLYALQKHTAFAETDTVMYVCILTKRVILVHVVTQVHTVQLVQVQASCTAVGTLGAGLGAMVHACMWTCTSTCTCTYTCTCTMHQAPCTIMHHPCTMKDVLK